MPSTRCHRNNTCQFEGAATNSRRPSIRIALLVGIRIQNEAEEERVSTGLGRYQSSGSDRDAYPGRVLFTVDLCICRLRDPG
jgi:hypothetical protein